MVAQVIVAQQLVPRVTIVTRGNYYKFKRKKKHEFKGWILKSQYFDSWSFDPLNDSRDHPSSHIYINSKKKKHKL